MNDQSMSALYSEPLVFACFTLNPVTLFNRIQQGCDVNRQDDQKRTPLHAAAYIGNAECCQTLLESGAMVNVKDHLWVTPLHWACVNGDDDCVQTLLEHHADAGSRDKNYQTPIHVAAANGHVALCQRLHAAGATASLPDRQGRTPLHLAAYNGFAEVVTFLMSKKAEVDKKDRGGRTPLHWAAFRGHEPVVALFSESTWKVKDINIQDKAGCSPLHAAAASGSDLCIQTLLRNGANANAKDAKGRTPLHYAASGGFNTCIETLATASTNVNALDVRGQTALHKAAHHGDVEALEVLLEKDADPEIQDKKGRTALHVACGKGDLDCVDLLIQEGKESKTFTDSNDNSLIHYAVRRGHLHLIHLFNIYKMDLATPGQRAMTPLHVAALFGHINCVRFLAELKSDDGQVKVDINAVDENGRGAIHAAAFAGTFDAVEFLISQGANCNVVDATKRTPLHYAAAMSNEHVCKMIHESMEDRFRRAVDEMGRTALHYAASADYDCVRYFMREGGVATQGDKNYMTPIHTAAWYGHKRSIEWMIENVTDSTAAVNATDKNNRAPLHFAACAGHPDALEALVNTPGVKIDAVDDKGRTPLDAAAFNGHPECLELLLEKDAEINVADKDGRTPLMAAATMGMEEAVEMLLGDEDEADADVTKLNNLGRNALMLAACAGSEECVRMILDNGSVDVNAADTDGMTALHLAVTAVNAVEDPALIKDILEALVSADADVSVRDSLGRTLAHLAAIGGCDDILRSVAEKFPVNAVDHSGHTPMHYACYHGHSACVQVLVDEDVEFKNNQESAFGVLHCIAIKGSDECLEVLFEELEDDNALDLNAVDDTGRTALHWAAECGFGKVIELLGSTDAVPNLEIQDGDGNTALMLAVAAGQHEVCVTLVSGGAAFEALADSSGTRFLHAAFAANAPAGGADVLEAVLEQLDEKEATKEVIEDYLLAEDAEGQNVLHLAAGKYDLAAIKIFLGRVAKDKAPMDKKDKAGYTPLHHLIPTTAGRDCLDVVLEYMA